MNSSQLKFLVDVGVGKKVEQYLQEQGYDTKNVMSINSRMPGLDIIHLAALENRMIITMDKDFGELVYHSVIAHAGILLLRLEDATGLEKLQVVKSILEEHSSRIINCFCVFQNDRLRIRKLNR